MEMRRMKTSEKIVYKTKVNEVGSEAKGFRDIQMLILFGNEAPDALRSSCYIIDVNRVDENITTGMLLAIDGKKYKITAVGNEVQNNLTNLGHIAISFTGTTVAELPGTLYVEKGDYPELNVNTQIEILDLKGKAE
ncbi:PTS system, glucitol/sorbitol-specific IIA component [Liquorilactobacillus sucicola DSM 21376 = JCM 15457]|uniref:PTS system, glucitol sorbitol-specific IIA component n=2 Tax=Liquorilactobacillus sucicola TaxID=519050 RepID=A0A023CXH2_9LACO|nr:PTS system, glucitol sorbitol-specific IIA component [Liquorilactobacillus sucicola DSM 21376 = JCM 15457]GAJ26577.1 PTS system, glucitol/sorbitol-specific IIA component [Liquorilactobacillus sucicola DSM 21376 = JCM 15457]